MKFGLIGEKLSHSYSKIIHNLLGVDYELFEVENGGLDNFINNLNLKGFNVTIPYKQDIMKYLDYISEEASAVNAVNTVLEKDGKLYGHNTDVLGFIYMLKRKRISLKDKCVMVLGSGGASKSAVYVAQKQGAKSVTVVGRTLNYNYQNFYELQDTQVIINTTPVGMYPNYDGEIVDLKKFKNLIAVFDFIYNPLKTNIIKQAEELNLISSNGISMLVEQALSAEDIWFDTTHPHFETELAIGEIIKRSLNVTLVGMPGSGKSTIGKELAKALNKEFFDLDEEIFNEYNKSPADIIKESGEEYFREIETKVLKKTLLASNRVVALGGGAIIKEENRNFLKYNSISVYVERDLDKLSLDNRPLSLANGVEKLYNERKAYYESANVKVKNDKEIIKTVKEIKSIYETACIKWS